MSPWGQVAQSGIGVGKGAVTDDDLVGTPNCERCLTPMAPAGSVTRPYLRFAHCGATPSPGTDTVMRWTSRIESKKRSMMACLQPIRLCRLVPLSVPRCELPFCAGILSRSFGSAWR